MNYLIKPILLIIITIIEIVFSQSVYNQQLYDRKGNNQNLSTSESKSNWISQENLANAKTILETTISSNQYIVGPGDQFTINLIAADGVFNYTLEVTPTGELLLPLIGLINIDQLSLKSAIEQIKILGNSKYDNAKLEITLTKLRNFKVHINGAIKESGFVIVSPIDRLSNVIKKAGDFLPLSKEFNIMITHLDGTIDYINYLKFIRTGNMINNPIIKNGDRINIPFGNIRDESIQIRGAVQGNGYDIIEPKESLWQFIQRRISFTENATLDRIYISRSENDLLIIESAEFDKFILESGDRIDIQEELAVFITGFVKNPGRYKYFIGFSVDDYLGLAGGNLTRGNIAKVQIQHIDNTISVGLHNQIKRGDIIYVPERNLSKLVGELSILQIISYLFSIALTYIAATN